MGTYRYTVVFLAPEIAARLPFDRHPRLRTSGEIGEWPFSGASQPVRGRWYVMLSKPLLRSSGYGGGDTVEVRFRLEDPESIETPEALREALEADSAAAAGWSALSPGQRRGLAYRVASARTLPTRERRLREVLEAMRG